MAGRLATGMRRGTTPSVRCYARVAGGSHGEAARGRRRKNSRLRADATHLLQLSVHPKVVADRLGHGDPALILRVYTHVIPAVQETVAALAADLIASSGE